MKITLYKDCVVRDTYSRVFSPTVFEDYLATLTKTDFDIDSSYAIMGGSFSFDWSLVNAASPYVYNYMKVDDDDNGIMFYAFVNRVDLANGCVVISYTNDIWHTFIGGCRMYDSLVNQSKHAPTGKYHFLPIDYLTNERVNWKSLEDKPIGGSSINYDKLVLGFELQIYETAQSGTVADRVPVVAFTEFKPEDDKEGFEGLKDAESIISQLLSKQAQQVKFNSEILYGAQIGGVGLDGYYEIVNVFLLRKSWMTEYFSTYDQAIPVIMSGSVSGEPYYFEYYNIDDARTYNVGLFTYKVSGGRYPSGDAFKLRDYTIPNNFKIVSVGSYTSPTFAMNNGTENRMSLYISTTGYHLNLYLSMYGQRYDITELFKLNIPFTSINGETAQLRKIADQEKRDKAISRIVWGTLDAINETVESWGGASGGTPKAALFQKIGGTIRAANKLGRTITDSAIEINAATAKKYQTNYAQDVEVDAEINVFYGLGYYYLLSVDNQEEVDFAIDNYGYSMGVVPTTDLPYNPFNLESGYNPTSYSQINLFGSCPQSILNELEGILIRGTKIYYSLEEVNGSTN